MLSVWIFLCAQSFGTGFVDVSLSDLPARAPGFQELVLAGPDQPYRVQVKGPARIRIVSRSVVTEGIRHYDLPVWIDGSLAAVYRYKTVAARDADSIGAPAALGHRLVG
jgi:hypothetical protein